MSDGTDNPLMGAAFARTYAQVSGPLTGPIATMALDRLRPFAPGARLLDIAAGTGALAVPAAELGLAVLAIDIAPGMVEHLACRLRPYPAAEARIMDGQDLALGDAEFDVATSMFGLHYFADWRRGLTEMARVLRSGGRAAVAG